MLRFYYTVSSGYNSPQSKVSDSLGGYKSSTLVPNDVFGNLFDEISLNLASNPHSQYVALVLKNEGTETFKNVELWFSSVTDNPYGTITVGAIGMGKDEEENPVTSRTSSMNEKPYWIQFYEAKEEEPVSLGDMEAGDEICLWFCRSLDKKIIKNDYDLVAERDTNTQNRYKKVEKETDEIFNINLVWE
jgi:hypothetical protein|nr:MAG TPA: hypothetical protein [Caudoviricetes sp.]